VQYGLDAQRLVVWLASGCNANGRRLAGRLEALLSRGGRGGALALSPSGDVLNAQSNAMPLVAAAAAGLAAGRPAERDRLLARAAQVDRARPTYYGTAWLALGRTLLTTRLLGGCPEAGR
jgi:endoglucanase